MWVVCLCFGIVLSLILAPFVTKDTHQRGSALAHFTLATMTSCPPLSSVILHMKPCMLLGSLLYLQWFQGKLCYTFESYCHWNCSSKPLPSEICKRESSICLYMLIDPQTLGITLKVKKFLITLLCTRHLGCSFHSSERPFLIKMSVFLSK